MTRTVASFLFLSFILWVLPLGAFIKPSQEKSACDGERAICMCHVFVPKSAVQAIEPGINLKAVSSSNKENPSGGGKGGNHFISVGTMPVMKLPLHSFLEDPYFCYKNPLVLSLEHVPKI